MSAGHRPPQPSCPLLTLKLERGPERLVGVGFRCWMAGYQTGDIACWEEAWNHYSAELGERSARVAMGELSCWVRKIRQAAGREIDTYPAGCRTFCRDECVAVSMIAAAQHKVCPALRACAFALIGSGAVDDVMQQTDSFALTLAAMDQRLAPATIALASSAALGDVMPASTARH